MANCNHDCNSCKSTCSKKDFLAPMNAHSRVKKVIGVVSGKGGVGKSSVTSLLALAKQREGYKVAILDGDITGPSIGRIFGVENKQVLSNGKEFTPVESSQGIKIMSTNLLLESNDTPVIWRRRYASRYWRCPSYCFSIITFRWDYYCDKPTRTCWNDCQ